MKSASGQDRWRKREVGFMISRGEGLVDDVINHCMGLQWWKQWASPGNSLIDLESKLATG